VARRQNAAVGLLVLIALGAQRPLFAGTHQVWDEAHFFKPKTLEQIDEMLQEIHARFGKDLMIETFASIPDDLKPALQRDGKDKFYQTWTNSEGLQLEVNGLLILVTGDPPHLQVEVGLDTRQKIFTLEDRTEMAKALAVAFHQKDFDGGIIDAVQFVRDRMARNMAGGPTTQPTTRPAAPVSAPVSATEPPRPQMK
jgi:uncharacterized membrane protein YgcG